MLEVDPDIKIPERELHERFVRASGPGGQHVNKTATAVQLRFCIHASTCLPQPVARRLLEQAGSRINQAGELVIEASRFRSQERNRVDARQRLARLIARAAQPPRPRRKTHPPSSINRRRLATKKQRASKKALRQPPDGDA